VTPSPTATTAPPVLDNPHFLPLAFMAWHNGEEPNDRCAEAYEIYAGIPYEFLPDDRDDWFTFQLAAPSDLTVVLTDFSPLAGQVAVYRGEGCMSAQLLGHNGDSTSEKTVALGSQPAGRYYLYVSNDGALSATEKYKLGIVAQP
jgi:hypothetical protein